MPEKITNTIPNISKTILIFEKFSNNLGIINIPNKLKVICWVSSRKYGFATLSQYLYFSINSYPIYTSLKPR